MKELSGISFESTPVCSIPHLRPRQAPRLCVHSSPSIQPVHQDDMSIVDDAPAPPPARLSDDAIKGVVRDLNKKEKFEEACLVLHAQVTHHFNPSPPEGLFAAVLRVGTVLKTRHAEGSAAWKFGLRLFKDAVAGGGFNGRGDVDKLQDLLHAALAATDAADAAPENAGDGVDHDESGGDARARAAGPGGRAAADPTTDRRTHQAFEGQLSGDLESEFDRQRRSGVMGRANRGPQLDAAQLMMNGIRGPNDDLNSVSSEGGLEELMRSLVSAAAASGGSGPGGGGGGEGGGGGDASRDPAELRRRLEEWVRNAHPESAQDILRALRRIETVAAAAANGDDNEGEDVVDEATMERLAAAAADAATRTHRSVGKSHPHSSTRHRNCFLLFWFLSST